MPFRSRFVFALPLFAVCAFAWAQTAPTALADCAAIAANNARLACFDRLVADGARAAVVAAPPAAANGATAVAAAPAAPVDPADKLTMAEMVRALPKEPFSIADHWELGAENKRGVFGFRPHRQNYLQATYSSAPNGTPYLPFRTLPLGTHALSKSEIAFQLGFKMKAIEDVSPLHADLWFAYTQKSYWQAYNRDASSAFRETNYQPEIMLVVPLDLSESTVAARFVNFGLVHESNGQAATLSRSWNRFYIQTGLDVGKATVLARVWKRLPERDIDDNPDILDNMGYGDIQASYRRGGQLWSVLMRRNFRTGHGALQVGWTFPLLNHLKGNVQYFSGYGQSLIDYNYAQKTLGAGFVLDF